MTYARARLWLGIGGVGMWVLSASAVLCRGLPQQFSEQTPLQSLDLLRELGTLSALLIAALLPFDLLGGFFLPRAYGKSSQSFYDWLWGYSRAVAVQLFGFTTLAMLLLLAGWWGGLPACLAVIFAVMSLLAVARDILWRGKRRRDLENSFSLVEAERKVGLWGIRLGPTLVVEHRDRGFTGGVIGWRRPSILLPENWLHMTAENLAVVLARRSLAISSGSYRRGLVLAIAWNLVGFAGAALLTPGGGISTLTELLITMCGFTLWTFVGLLLLPTWSRYASRQIDAALAARRIPPELIASSAAAVDQRQDDEPQRPAWIERIFHPVPSVRGRIRQVASSPIAPWHVARTMLLFSWPCLGLMARSVHCNVGRPELWLMYPSD